MAVIKTEVEVAFALDMDIFLRVAKGATFADIAKEMKLSTGRIAQRFHKARRCALGYLPKVAKDRPEKNVYTVADIRADVLFWEGVLPQICEMRLASLEEAKVLRLQYRKEITEERAIRQEQLKENARIGREKEKLVSAIMERLELYFRAIRSTHNTLEEYAQAHHHRFQRAKSTTNILADLNLACQYYTNMVKATNAVGLMTDVADLDFTNLPAVRHAGIHTTRSIYRSMVVSHTVRTTLEQQGK